MKGYNTETILRLAYRYIRKTSSNKIYIYKDKIETTFVGIVDNLGNELTDQDIVDNIGIKEIGDKAVLRYYSVTRGEYILSTYKHGEVTEVYKSSDIFSCTCICNGDKSIRIKTITGEQEVVKI